MALHLSGLALRQLARHVHTLFRCCLPAPKCGIRALEDVVRELRHLQPAQGGFEKRGSSTLGADPAYKQRILVEYVVLVKTTFYISLGYSMVGFCGVSGSSCMSLGAD